MQSSTSIGRFRSLHLLSFRLRHRLDWTRFTKPERCVYQSLAWLPFKDEFNYELGLLRWMERKTSPQEFFEKLIQKGLLYSVVRLEPLTHSVYLVGFTGPYNNTVREKILEFEVNLYTSKVSGGAQEWTLAIDRELEKRFIEVIKDLGNLYDQTSRTPTPQELYGLVATNTQIVKSVSFLLTPKELEYLGVANGWGYFKRRRGIGLKEIASSLERNPSTVDRGLRSGVDKLLSLLCTLIGLQVQKT